VAELDRECRALTRYLVGREPSDGMTGAYCRCDRVHTTVDRFDGLLLSLALTGGPTARIADAYSSRFRRGSVLRRKMVLVLALAECDPDLAESIDTPDGPGLALWASLGLAAILSFLALVTGVVLLGPVHLVCGMIPGGGGHE